MEEFISLNNKKLLLFGSNKMLIEKLNMNISSKDLSDYINDIINEINIKYKDKKFDLKKLNNICLTNIKQYFESLELEKKNTSGKKPLEKKPLEKKPLEKNENINNEIIEKKYDGNFLDLKVKELEKNRNHIPNYDIINDNDYIEDNNYIEEKNKDIDNILNTTINYNTNTISEINYKSFAINSLNRDWFVNINRNYINYDLNNLNIDISKYKYIPYCLLLPSYINNLTPYINLEIIYNNYKINYIFICENKNKNWNIWKTLDNLDIEFNYNVFTINLYDNKNKLLDMGNDKIMITQILLIHKNNLKIYKLWCEYDYIYNFNNNYEINDYIEIRTKNGKKYYKKIINIEENNIIFINDENDELLENDFQNSCIMLYKNQFSLIMKYYIK